MHYTLNERLWPYLDGAEPKSLAIFRGDRAENKPFPASIGFFDDVTASV